MGAHVQGQYNNGLVSLCCVLRVCHCHQLEVDPHTRGQAWGLSIIATSTTASIVVQARGDAYQTPSGRSDVDGSHTIKGCIWLWVINELVML